MHTPEVIRNKVAENLHRARMTAEIPELGAGRRGKVRHLYSIAGADEEDLLVLSTSDRVSVFDTVQGRAIPFKGAVLNALTRWAFGQTADIVPNALVESRSPHIMIQRRLAGIGVECIVRGYLWGGLASDYERGRREKCGVVLPDGLWRYQKLDHPIFTPTTKAEQGHDQDISFPEMAPLMEKRLANEKIRGNGHRLAAQVKKISLRLYRRGAKLADKAGLILVDTKFEFGLDPRSRLALIDEMFTPDCSRYVDRLEWQKKWALIKELMSTGEWPTVGHLLNDHPELKIAELSKQLIRDVLLEAGYDPKKGRGISLRDEDIVEAAARYIELCERLTGEEFDFDVYHDAHIDISKTVQRDFSSKTPDHDHDRRLR